MIWRSEEFFRTPYLFLKEMKKIIRYASVLCAVLMVVSCRYGVFIELHRPIGQIKGIVEIKDGIGDWDAAYMVEQGYFCMKQDLQLNALTYMSPDKGDKIGLLATRSERIPTQIVGDDGVLYFSFPNDTILELLFDNGRKVEMLDSIAFKKANLPGFSADLNDDAFKSILANTSSLLDRTIKIGDIDFITALKEIFESVLGMDYVESDSDLNNLDVNESGNYEFSDTMDEWYDEEIEEVVYNTLSLWTGKATFKVGGSSCTLSGTIWCPSESYNDYGTYGILCDSNVDNLYYGSAEYQGKGYQSAEDLSFDVDFRGFRPNTTYYYRAYYRFNSSDHGNLVPKYGDSSDQVFYDTVVKSFRTGDNILTVDVVMCMDVTGSMSDVINTVKSNAIEFYDLFNSCCVKNGITMSGLNTQVIAFRDKNVDGSQWMQISPTYNLPEDASQFKTFVNELTATGGGDFSESGLEALEKAFSKTDWGKDDGYHRQVVIVWTDAPYLVGSEYTDLTLNDIHRLWNAMPSGRRMILFAPDGSVDVGGSWNEFDTWTNVIHETDLTSGFSNFEYILESIIAELTGKSMPNRTRTSVPTPLRPN